MGPFVRILLRYIAGALAFRGLIPPETAQDLATDPDVIGVVTQGIDWGITMAGVAIGAATEWAYRFAKKHGWAT